MTEFIINVRKELDAETVDRWGSQDSCMRHDLATQPERALGRLGQRPSRAVGKVALGQLDVLQFDSRVRIHSQRQVEPVQITSRPIIRYLMLGSSHPPASIRQDTEDCLGTLRPHILGGESSSGSERGAHVQALD